MKSQKAPPKVYRGKLSNQSCKWSPFEAGRLVVAQSSNFGLIGTGCVSVLNVSFKMLTLIG